MFSMPMLRSSMAGSRGRSGTSKGEKVEPFTLEAGREGKGGTELGEPGTTAREGEEWLPWL
jgi:hypothetical protein